MPTTADGQLGGSDTGTTDPVIPIDQGFLTIGTTGDDTEVRSCCIPDDHIDPRRSEPFMAKSVLRDIRNGVRAAIQASGNPASVLAERFGTAEQTAYK